MKFIRNCLCCQNNFVNIISQVAICNPSLTHVTIIEVHWTVMANYPFNLIGMTGTLYLLMYVLCTSDVLLDLINVREGNIRCDGFTRE